MSSTCTSCPSICKNSFFNTQGLTCKSLNECTSCHDGFYLNKFGSCEKCDESCKLITNSLGWTCRDAGFQNCLTCPYQHNVMIANICFDKRSTKFQFFNLKEIFLSETDPAIHLRFEAPISSNITSFENSVTLNSKIEPPKFQVNNETQRLLQELTSRNFSEIGEIKNITLDDSRTLITVEIEPSNSKSRLDVTVSPAHNFFYAEDDLTHVYNINLANITDPVLGNLSFYRLKIEDSILKYMGWIFYLMITWVLYYNVITRFFKMRPFIKYFQILRIMLMTQSSLPSNLGNLLDFVVKRSSLEIIPRFLTEFKFLDKFYNCTPDQILTKAGYGCGVIGNLLPLLFSFAIFLILTLFTKLFILDCVKPLVTPEQRKKIAYLRALKKEKGSTAELTDQEVKDALPEMVITKTQLKIELVLGTIGTIKFWYYLLDYLLIDLFFISFVALKKIPEVFWNGQTFGRIDIILNLALIYISTRFFRCKFETINKIQELQTIGIDSQTILKTQIKSGQAGIEYMIVKTKEELERFCDRWSFISNEFSYIVEDKYETKAPTQGTLDKEKPKDLSLSTESQLIQGAESSSTIEDLKKMIKYHQVKIQDAIQALIVLVMVFTSEWFWVHIPILALILASLKILQITNMLPQNLPRGYLWIPICSILGIKFILAFNPVSKF